MNTKPLYRPETAELLTYDDAKRINPLVEINTDDSALNAMGFFRVQDEVDGMSGQPTTTDPYSEVVEIAPILISGQYLRQYQVRQLFTADIVEGGQTITIQQQQQRYDAAKLAEKKADLRQAVADGYALALAVGMPVSLPDQTAVTVDLTTAAALQRIMHLDGTGATRTLISRSGLHEMTPAEYASLVATINGHQSALAIRRSVMLTEVSALSTMAAANAYDTTVNV